MNFRTWAPLAEEVELILNGTLHPMTREERGWWSTNIPETVAGARYRYRIDGRGPFPDPRSPSQPWGVHGDSAHVDLRGLRDRTQPVFRQVHLRDAVLYELHIGTFTVAGTFSAVIEKLPHLVDLGVTHVEIMPVAAFPGNHGWGYDGVSLYAPHAAYGTPQDLADLVAACHAHGLAVLLDVVYNHLGPDGNHLPNFGPYFTHATATPWGAAVNLDGPHSDGVREFIIDNALMWLRDYGFDGLRLDAVHELYDGRAVHILEELSTRVRLLEQEENRPLVLIAESNQNNPGLVYPTERGGYGLDAHWADELHHAIHVYLTGERRGYYADFSGLGDIARALAAGYIFQGQFSPARLRSHGRPPEGVEPHQMVVCSQNHDQTGNRAFGERLTLLASPAQVKAAMAMVLLSPWVPLLFQGEEWGARTPFLFFSDHQSPELREKIRRSRYEEFKAFEWGADIPDPSDPASFEKSKLDWSESRGEAHQEILRWCRMLIQLRRRSRTDFTQPVVQWDENGRWLTLRRGTVLAAFNFSDVRQVIPIPPGNWMPVPAGEQSISKDAAVESGRTALFTMD